MVTAEIPYTVDTGEKLVNETFGPNNIRRRTTGSSERRAMSIEDGRTRGTDRTDRLSKHLAPAKRPSIGGRFVLRRQFPELPSDRAATR